MQRSQTSNPRTGCSSTTRTNASRVWLSEAPSPHTWRQGRPDTLPSGSRRRGEKNRRLRTQGWAAGPRWCWRPRCQPLSLNLILITSYLGLLSRRKNPPGARKLRSVTALPRLFISYTCAVFSHSSQASSLTATLNQHICMFSSISASGDDSFFSYCLNATVWRMEYKSLLRHLHSNSFDTGG